MSTESTHNVHLLVLIHGMWGNPSHLASMNRIMKETRIHQISVDQDGTTLHVMMPETNKDEGTYDGIDWGGERLATEILQEIEKLESDGRNVVRFSITGYSLGGLLARYVVGCVLSTHFLHHLTGICSS
jgi:predicted esterase